MEIIIILLCVILYLYLRKKKRKKESIIQNNDIQHIQRQESDVKQELATDKSMDINTTDNSEWPYHLYDESDSDRNYLCWEIDNFFRLYKQCIETKDIYEFDKLWEKYPNEYEKYKELSSRRDFKTLYRLIRGKYKADKIPFSLLITSAVAHPDKFNINVHQKCLALAKSYRDYGLNVLSNYKIQSAFEKRKAYYLEKIPFVSGFKCMEGCTEAIKVLADFKDMIPHIQFQDGVIGSPEH